MKYAVCPDCEGRGTSSAYLGAFTSEDLDDMGEEGREDLAAGRFDRPCSSCNGQRVVAACACGEPVAISSNPWGDRALSACCDHIDEDEKELADMDSIARAEARIGYSY